MASTRQLRSAKRRAQQQSSSTVEHQVANARGLPSLANELYLEILSHLPAFPIPSRHHKQEIKLYGRRRLALDALSQTCRSLRWVFLRYRWQRIEVYDQMDLGRGPLPGIRYKTRRVTSACKVYAMELLRQLETVTVRNPSLAEYVNVLDILVADYSAKSVLSELARCITCLPNLHTVQIHFDVGQRKLIEESFSPYTYPQIRFVCVTTDASSFLYSCPGVKVIIPRRDGAEYYGINHFFKDIISKCTSIETLGHGSLSWSDHRISLISQLKNLRDVTFELVRLPRDSEIKALWGIGSLQIIRLMFRLGSLKANDVEDWKMRMDQILCITPELISGGKHKKLVVTFR